MSDHDPADIIEAAEREREAIREHYLPAVEWFLARAGLDRRPSVVADLAADLALDRDVANVVVGHLVSDEADPVQQVIRPSEGKYVGVIDHAEHDWFYAFDRYDDVEGRQRRAVCAHCVHEQEKAADVTHFTRSPDDFDHDLAHLALALHYHVDHEGRALRAVLQEDLAVDPEAFADRHGLADPAALSLRAVTRRLDADPALQPESAGGGAPLTVPDVDVQPGASLVSGTTIGGNEAWHAGNDGTGSGLDADTLDARHATEVDTLVWRDASGNARIAASLTTVTNTYPVTSDTIAWTQTATSSWGAAFLDASYDDTYFTLDVYQNGATLSADPFTYLARDVTTGDTFQFVWHATNQPYAYSPYLSATVKGARTVPAPE